MFFGRRCEQKQTKHDYNFGLYDEFVNLLLKLSNCYFLIIRGATTKFEEGATTLGAPRFFGLS
jgi:hypothetical protein